MTENTKPNIKKINNQLKKHKGIKIAMLSCLSLSLLFWNIKEQYAILFMLSSLVFSMYYNKLLNDELKLKNG